MLKRFTRISLAGGHPVGAGSSWLQRTHYQRIQPDSGTWEHHHLSWRHCHHQYCFFQHGQRGKYSDRRSLQSAEWRVICAIVTDHRDPVPSRPITLIASPNAPAATSQVSVSAYAGLAYSGAYVTVTVGAQSLSRLP